MVLGIIGKYRTTPTVAALLKASQGSREEFNATYDRLQPRADEVGALITLCGRMYGVKDQDILENLEEFLQERGL